MVAIELPNVLRQRSFNEKNYQEAKQHVKLDFTKKEAKVLTTAVKNQEQTEEYEQYRINLEEYVLF